MPLTRTSKIWITVLAIPVGLIVAAIIGAEIYFTSDRLKALVVPKIEASSHRSVAVDRKSTRLNSSHVSESRMPSSA